MILLASLSFLLNACSDDDYTTSSSARLVLSADTVSFDTVFAGVPTAMKDLWIFNTGKSHIRLSSVRQERGNQSGFRVNIDGIYLGNTTGWQTSDVEVRAGDSIRVFVELTAVQSSASDMQVAEDNILLTLESGNVQKVNLRAVARNALILDNPVVSSDTTYTPDKPILVYGGLTIEEGAVLTLEAGTSIYLHDAAGIDVFGTLIANGEPGNEVVLRGYRTDRMFDYLPYDGVSGQWQGVHFYESSYDNRLKYTDLHNAFTGVEIDSADVNRTKLILENSTIHNCQGYCLNSKSASLELRNCQLSNALDDCMNVDGGNVEANNCTFAQFYPFDAGRGVAFRFASSAAPADVVCTNSLITGYANDELQLGDTLLSMRYRFDDCIIRSVEDESIDTLLFAGTRFETSSDTLPNGKEHFAKIDTDNLQYDFSLSEDSPCVDAANPLTALPEDRKGTARDGKPDIGAYELIKQEE